MGDDMHPRHLTEANRSIATGCDLIAKQRDLVDRLEKDGLDASEAWRFLGLLEETLSLLQATVR